MRFHGLATEVRLLLGISHATVSVAYLTSYWAVCSLLGLQVGHRALDLAFCMHQCICGSSTAVSPGGCRLLLLLERQNPWFCRPHLQSAEMALDRFDLSLVVSS